MKHRFLETRNLFLVVPSLVVLSSTAQAQQPFDATHCYVGTAAAVFASDDATIAHFEHNGIYRGNQESKLLDGFSIQCAGVNVVINKKSSVRGGCRVLDPKGDTIGLTFEGTGGAKGSGTAVAVAGTGAWKGVTGGGDWEVQTISKPLAAGAFQACLRYHGAFTVPN
jgi:hypothetical protein